MFARTTLALMLACPVATGVLISPHSALAEIPKTCRHSCQTHNTPTDRRVSHVRRTRNERLAARRAATAPAATWVLSKLYPGPNGLASQPQPGLAGQPSPIPLVAPARQHPWQTGVASWYGGARWQGHMTSDGHCYDENELTAAHASLPLGSQAAERLIGTDRVVVVTITDRPGTRRRVIDLSRAAAEKLGILSRGVATVAIDPL
jgi:rare lipoprotein A (peptidoglycan hydrolase)